MSDNMPSVITIGNYKVAVGGNWKASPTGEMNSKEISKLSKACGSNFGAIMKAEGIVGFYAPEAKGAPSGAAWLASSSTEANLVLIEEIPEDPSISWLCIIKQGNPVIDVVCKNNEIAEIIQEWSHGSPPVFSKSYFYDETARPLTLVDLVGGSKPQHYVKQVNGVDPKLILGGAVLFVVVGVGVVGNHFWTAYKKEKARKDAMQSASLKDEQLRLEIERIRRENTMKIDNALKTNYFEDASIKERVSSWLDTIGSYPVHFAGWTALKAECNKLDCTIIYKRDPQGTVNTFFESATRNGWQISNWTPDECSLISNLSSSNRRANISNVGERDQSIKDMISSFQRLSFVGLKFDVKKPEQMTLALESYPDGTQDPINWDEGVFTVGGSSVAEPRGIYEYIEYDTLTAETITVNIESSAWEIKGKYLVKK